VAVGVTCLDGNWVSGQLHWYLKTKGTSIAYVVTLSIESVNATCICDANVATTIRLKTSLMPSKGFYLSQF
jgi:hypothetical protein